MTSSVLYILIILLKTMLVNRFNDKFLFYIYSGHVLRPSALHNGTISLSTCNALLDFEVYEIFEVYSKPHIPVCCIQYNLFAVLCTMQ